MVEFRFTEKQVKSGKITEEEFNTSKVKCAKCGSDETKGFLQDCEDCCGVPCWHEELCEEAKVDFEKHKKNCKTCPKMPLGGDLISAYCKNYKPSKDFDNKFYCCDCSRKKDPARYQTVVEGGKKCCPTFPSVKFSNISDDEIIEEIKLRFKERKAEYGRATKMGLGAVAQTLKNSKPCETPCGACCPKK